MAPAPRSPTSRNIPFFFALFALFVFFFFSAGFPSESRFGPPKGRRTSSAILSHKRGIARLHRCIFFCSLLFLFSSMSLLVDHLIDRVDVCHQAGLENVGADASALRRAAALLILDENRGVAQRVFSLSI